MALELMLVVLLGAEGEVSLLTDGRFHGEDVKNVGGGWYGQKDGHLRPVKLSAKKIRDPLLDEEMPKSVKTGIEISSNVKANFYVKGLTPGTVTETPLDGQRSLGDGALVKVGDATLQAITEGKVQKLVLTQGGKSQVLYQQTDGDLDGWSVHWAGDLDRDGKQDFVVYADEHYAVKTLRLFLSTRAKDGELVHEAAKFTATSC